MSRLPEGQGSAGRRTSQDSQDTRSLSQQIHQTQQHLAQLQNLVKSGGFQPQQALLHGSGFPQQVRLPSNPQVPESNAWVTGDPQLLRLVHNTNFGVRDRPGADQLDSPVGAHSAIPSSAAGGGGPYFHAGSSSLLYNANEFRSTVAPSISRAPSHPPGVRLLGIGQGERSSICGVPYMPMAEVGAQYRPPQKSLGAAGEGLLPSNAFRQAPMALEHSASGIHAGLQPALATRQGPLASGHMTQAVLLGHGGGEGGAGALGANRMVSEGEWGGQSKGVTFAEGVGFVERDAQWNFGAGDGAMGGEGSRKRRAMCEHGVARSGCKACGGSLCEHGRQRSRCRDCGGSGVCVHKRQRGTCKECGGSQICEHNRRRSLCKQCGGSQICVHGRQRSYCKECKGSGVCEHNRRRSSCKDCGGSGICVHRRLRRQCKECGGSSICPHGRQRSLCKDCGGSQICAHNKRRKQCRQCQLEGPQAARSASASADSDGAQRSSDSAPQAGGGGIGD